MVLSKQRLETQNARITTHLYMQCNYLKDSTFKVIFVYMMVDIIFILSF